MITPTDNSVLVHAAQTIEKSDGSQTEQLIDRWYSTAFAWRDLTLELSANLWAARQRYRDNQEFGEWLNRHAHRLSKNDRAALIHMGQHLEISRKVLEQSNRHSPQHIWRDLVKPRLLPSSLTEEDGTQTTVTDAPEDCGSEAPDKEEVAPRTKAKLWGNAEHTEAQFPILVNSAKALFVLIKDKELLAAKLQLLVSSIVPGATITFPYHTSPGHQPSTVQRAKRDIAKSMGQKRFEDIPNSALKEKLLTDQLAPSKTKRN